MALATTNPSNEVVVGPCTIPDISTTASRAYAAVPVTGNIVRAYSVLKGAITVADATWDLIVNGVTVTGSTVTVAFTGSANGDVDSVTVSPFGVDAGDYIRVTSYGESTTAAEADVYVVIRV